MSRDEVERGLGKLAKMRGEAAASAIRTVMNEGGLGAGLGVLAAEFAFASVWDREGALSDKYRSLVTIAVLATSGRTTELRNHIEIGFAHGLSLDELEQALCQVAVYAGFPAAWSALKEAQAVLGTSSSPT